MVRDCAADVCVQECFYTSEVGVRVEFYTNEYGCRPMTAYMKVQAYLSLFLNNHKASKQFQAPAVS